MLRRMFIVAAMIAMVACSSGAVNGTLPSTSGVGQPSHSIGTLHRAKGKLMLRIHVPKRHRHERVKVMRHGKPAYISPATQAMTVALSGPTSLTETVSLQPTAQGCTSSLTGTFCTLTLSGLAPGNYTATVGTYDAVTCPPSPGSCSIPPSANELSSAQNVGFTIVAGQNNAIGITLGGIPTAVALVPDANSTLSGGTSSGYTLSKCGSDTVSVIGVDADDNYILGAGAPTPSLTSDSATLTVATPAPASPNAFTITRPTTDLPAGGSTVHLTASVTPVDGGASAVTGSAIAMTFGNQICGVITEYPIPTANSDPQHIVKGPDGAMWFTEVNAEKIGRITSDGTITETSTEPAMPLGITSGSDGALWFTGYGSDQVDRMTTAGTITNAYSTTISQPRGITSGPDGALWFVGANGVGTVTTGGTVTEYTSGFTSAGMNIVTGADGALWFTECAPSKIGRITTTGTITETPLPAGYSYPINIASGPDDALWFFNSASVARITTDGIITEYASVSTDVNSTITTGADGALWFVNCASHQLERMTTNAVVTAQYPIPTPSFVGGIAPGPNATLWFTDNDANVIGKVQ